MLKGCICGTIDGAYTFPNSLFSGFCYESWGNAWSLIDGVDWKYLSIKDITENISLLNDIDILMCEVGLEDFIDLIYNKVFVIGTESGSGFMLDLKGSVNAKTKYLRTLEKCGLILSTTHAGRENFSLLTSTPILDIPLPMDMNIFKPRNISKYDEFSVCLGETLEDPMGDRPLNLTAIKAIKSIGGKIITTLAFHHCPEFTEDKLYSIVSDNLYEDSCFEIQPYASLLEMSNGYLAKSHVSMMIGHRPTFGRFVYVSWAVGVPCIASRYQMQEKICPDLTVDVCEIDKIIFLLKKLKLDEDFYSHCRTVGLENIQQIENEKIALRIANEVLPIYFNRKPFNPKRKEF